MLINMLRQQNYKHWRRMFKYFFILIFISFSSRNGVCSVIAIRHLNAKYLFIFGVGSVRDGGNFFFFCFSRSLYSFLRLFFVCVFFVAASLWKNCCGELNILGELQQKCKFLLAFFCVSHPKKKIIKMKKYLKLYFVWEFSECFVGEKITANTVAIEAHFF